MTTNLQSYIDEKNVMRNIFGQELWDINNEAHRTEIAQRIESDLSPENLCCDGELPMAQVRKKHRLLTAAAKELEAIDPALKVYGA